MWHPLSSWMQNNLICVHACIKINDACMYRSVTHYLWHLWGGILTHPYLKHFAHSWSDSADCGGSYGICKPEAMLLSSNLSKYSSLSAHRKKFLFFSQMVSVSSYYSPSTCSGAIWSWAWVIADYHCRLPYLSCLMSQNVVGLEACKWFCSLVICTPLVLLSLFESLSYSFMNRRLKYGNCHQ